MDLGPLMLDLRGVELQADEREMLSHPLAGGVILFARNYSEPEALMALTAAVRAARQPPLLIAVDQEGGRVQRFQEGFTRLPPSGRFGALYDEAPARALALVERTGWLLANELSAVGVDFSFAPVLDLDTGASVFLGDRAYHRSPAATARLAQGLMAGLRRAGMAAVGKHFPGHGSARGDSHHEAPVDDRPYEAIAGADMAPFKQLIEAGLPALMPAHVIYPQVDDRPAGFSPAWLQGVLRKRLNFKGMIFSDDITMVGASGAGSYPDRAAAALEAGCDMVLVCNNQPEAAALLDNLKPPANRAAAARMEAMRGPSPTRSYWQLLGDPQRLRIAEELAALEASPALGERELGEKPSASGDA